ncbi:hypothetical protein QN277_025176 [Acacia crassicarpa]|uniref:Ionotropic glutamate receptor C-terminal domain-containing protein n=1 Tax=Acacia crassicarpa TaxID=499986 RepID=A0AAE1JIB1_9FABA|nr:hypothetical protein QN277_025176 [Acacia crassicarpa]
MEELQRSFRASCLLSVSVVLLLWLNITARPSMAVTQIVPIGVILDLGLNSVLGEMIHNSLAFAIKEYYSVNKQTATKIDLIVWNVSRYDIFTAASAAYDLMENKKVHAILGPQTSEQARYIVKLGEKYQVPVIWFPITGPSLLLPPSPSSIYSNEGLNCFQFRAIADIIKAVGWQSIVPIYEETEYGSHLLPCLSNVLKEMGIQMANVTAIDSSSTDLGINTTLDTLNNMRTHVFLVHMSMDLGKEFIWSAQQKEMMVEGYAWILTQELSSLTDPRVSLTRNLYKGRSTVPVEQFTDFFPLKRYMQGALGVRPMDSKNTDFRRNSEKIFNSRLPLYAWWAYHTIEALAKAVEKVEKAGTDNGLTLRSQILDTSFTAKSGVHFDLTKGQLDQSEYEVYNVIGDRERIIGSWSPETGLVQNHDKEDIETSSEYQLKDPMWPGDTLDKPPKLRIGVRRTNSFPEFVNVYNSTKLHFDGFAINVFSKAVKVLPFSLNNYEFVPLPNQSRSHNTSYDDILCRQMKEEDLDAIIGDITIVASRTKCVDFTLPYLDSSVAMVVRVKNISTSKGILLKPFKWSLWLILGAIFVGATIIINAFEIIRANNSRFNNPFLVYKIDVMENFESTTARWMVIMTSFLFVLVMQVYTAKLTSILTQGTTNEPSFKDENEIKSSNVPVGYKKGSWVRGLLIDQIGLKDEQLKGLGSREEYNEALSNGTVDAIFDETPYLILFLSRYRSRFMMTGTMYQTGGFSFAFPKKSGFTSHFSTAILNVTQEVESYRALMSQSSLPTSIEDVEFEDQNDIETSSLSISNIGGFYPVLISIVVAFLFGLFILNPSVIRWLSNLSQRLCPEFSAQTFKKLNPANPPNGQGQV